MDRLTDFAAERPRLVRIAAGLLGDRHEAEDVVQEAWLRLDRTDTQIQSLPAWLTTVTTRLCLDRLRARVPIPVDDATAASGRRRNPDRLGTAGCPSTRPSTSPSRTPSASRCRSSSSS